MRVLDFRGSYQIEIAEIRECVINHSKTVKCLHIDGEEVSSEELQSLI